MSFFQRFGPPLVAAAVGVVVATYTLRPSLSEMKRSDDAHKAEIKQVIAEQDRQMQTSAAAASPKSSN
ncbi:hypothetical protein H4R21_005981 [Coemansia helicoidea]|uniref:Uncharacterized protein n=1 Tax=Coemansia helicoidea TaxID=1286919 RepID=A0ACC1KQK2_9FUNG|nr:hypothetical protein H4R21_005981 [Coemansia helicoidea]